MSKTDVKNLTFNTKIQVLQDFIDELYKKPKRFNAEYLSCFRTLNTIARYKYYWQLDTTTNAKLIQFLIMTKKLLDEFENQNITDLIYIINNYLPTRSRSWMTCYFIFKTYNKHYKELRSIKFPMSEVPIDEFKEMMTDMELYDFRKIKKALKEEKKDKKTQKQKIAEMDLW